MTPTDQYRLVDSELVRALVTFPVLDESGTHLLQRLGPVDNDRSGTLWWVAAWIKQPGDAEPAVTYGVLDEATWEALPRVSQDVLDLAQLGDDIERSVMENPQESENPDGT